MAAGRGHAAARKDEILQRGQRIVEAVQYLFQSIDVGVFDHYHARDAQFAAKIEQGVLYLAKHFGDRGIDAISGQHHADRAVELVHRAVGRHAQRILAYP